MIEPNWMEIARKELDVAEFPGAASNPRILEYYRSTTLGGHLEDSSTPWCSAFVNWVMEQAGYRGTRRANARSWLEWGNTLEYPVHGAIAVLWRSSSDSAKGHVAFYDKDAPGFPEHVRLLGGNQGNRVGYQRYGKGRVLRYVWPRELDRLNPSTVA